VIQKHIYFFFQERVATLGHGTFDNDLGELAWVELYT
jgi:hypothetical protein